MQLSKLILPRDVLACCGKVKGRHGGDQLTKLSFASGYTFSVSVDANVSAEVVVT